MRVINSLLISEISLKRVFLDSTTSEECKNLDVVVPEQLLAPTADAVACETKEYKNSCFVTILHCLNSFQHNNYLAFSLLYVLPKEIHKIKCQFLFPHFIMAAIPYVKCDVGSGREIQYVNNECLKITEVHLKFVHLVKLLSNR